MASNDSSKGTARYVYRVKFRFDPALWELSIAPAEFETTLYRAADPPGEGAGFFPR